MNVPRIVDMLRRSRANRQQAEEALSKAEAVADEIERGQRLLQILTFQNQSIAALEQALLAIVE